VWAENLQEEFRKINELIDTYNHVAMDTEFPGIVARPTSSYRSSAEYHYATVRHNVDLLRVIQLGICLCDKDGNYIPNLCCWQFNFKFSRESDVYATEAMELLTRSGICFDTLEARGIEWRDFGELLMTSGIVLNPEVRWIAFHAGFDFGYLMKLLTCAPMPGTQETFFETLQVYCPIVYDIKYMMKSCENLRGGLQKVAELLDVHRIGPQHQAGSDALLTAATFFKMRKDYFESSIDDEKFRGVIFGLGAGGNGGGVPKISQLTPN
jgi:CCR4-NOT transcription complex subunit 7/8